MVFLEKGRNGSSCQSTSCLRLPSATLHAVLFISAFYIFFPSSWIEVWCKIFGFADQIISVSVISMLLINIHPNMKTLLSHINYGHDNIKYCTKTLIIQVFVGAVIIFTFLMMIYSITLFFTGTYGPVGGWCWITVEKNCKKLSTGLLEQMLLWYMNRCICSFS